MACTEKRSSRRLPEVSMPKCVTPSSSRMSRMRARTAVLAAGAGASVVLGAGVAAAAGSGAVSAASWVHPVGNYTLTAGFNQAGGMWRSTHSGQDFAVPSGAKVVAAYAGTVVKAGAYGAGEGPAYRKAVVIRHAGGTYSQ